MFIASKWGGGGTNKDNFLFLGAGGGENSSLGGEHFYLKMWGKS